MECFSNLFLLSSQGTRSEESIAAIAQFFLLAHGMRLATRDHPHSSCKPPLCLTDLVENSWYLHLVPFIAYHLCISYCENNHDKLLPALLQRKHNSSAAA